MYIRLYGSCGTYFGRSIAEVTDNIHAIGVINRFTGTQPSHLPQKPCNQKDTHLRIRK